MNAVMYGGGNIGRGFIGMLFSLSGYHTTFIDVAQPVVDALNQRGQYPVRILSGDKSEDITVTNVSAIDGRDTQAVADAIARSDIMATAVGVNILPRIASNLAAGIRRRIALGAGPLNILICENLINANTYLEELLEKELTEEEMAWFRENIGLVETTIGRMVPVQTEQMKDGEPLRVCVERYGFLPVDRDGFKGAIPHIRNAVPFSPFDFYIKRKLYVHNMGHATCAYLGDLLDLTYIYQAIDRDEVYIIVKAAMQESAPALSSTYSMELAPLLQHIDDLLERFTNRALQDTCQRVGADPRRKLSPRDRLIGAAGMVLEQGCVPAYIPIGAAAAVIRFLKEEDSVLSLQAAELVLQTVCGLSEESPLSQRILEYFSMLVGGASLGRIRRLADRYHAQSLGEVI